MGIYSFYQNGVLIGEHENVLTVAGRQAIFRYLAQLESGYARSMGLGIGSSTPNQNNTSLDFEVVRAEIIQSAPDFVNDKIVFKARIPQEVEAEFREVSIWSGFDASSAAAQIGALISFTEDEGWLGGVFSSNNNRYGGEGLRLTATNGNTSEAVSDDLFYDFSAMLQDQSFKLAIFAADSNCSGVSVQFRNDDLNYFEVSADPGSGYQILSFDKRDAVAEGSPAWEEIQSIKITASATGGTTNVDFDALRSDLPSSEEGTDVMISRALMAQPVLKSADAPMDVEYRLGVVLL